MTPESRRYTAARLTLASKMVPMLMLSSQAAEELTDMLRQAAEDCAVLEKLSVSDGWRALLELAREEVRHGR